SHEHMDPGSVLRVPRQPARWAGLAPARSQSRAACDCPRVGSPSQDVEVRRIMRRPEPTSFSPGGLTVSFPSAVSLGVLASDEDIEGVAKRERRRERVSLTAHSDARLPAKALSLS